MSNLCSIDNRGIGISISKQRTDNLISRLYSVARKAISERKIAFSVREDIYYGTLVHVHDTDRPRYRPKARRGNARKQNALAGS